MEWNWQHKNWPSFTYNSNAIRSLEDRLLYSSGLIFGAFKPLSEEQKTKLRIELLSTEALQTSKIEGENLNRDSLQSSICRQLGIQVDKRRISAAEQGISEMMIDLYHNYSEPLTHETLFKWHRMLTLGRTDLKYIGKYREDSEPMQIVSGSIGEPTIHFEAPPSKSLYKEMTHFLKWFDDSSPKGCKPLPALTRAGIAHLYFESIHPFEDGNGRIGRAITEKALAEYFEQPTLFAISNEIEKNKKLYYNAFEKVNSSLDITEWLLYFGNIILNAQSHTQKLIELVIFKAKLFAKLTGKLNARQERALLKLFEKEPDGFLGGLSAENYISITKASKATATRDLLELISLGALTKKGERRYTRYFLNFNMFDPEA